MAIEGSLKSECAHNSQFNMLRSAFTLPFNSSLNGECRMLRLEDSNASLFNIQKSTFALPVNSSLNGECRMSKFEVI